MFYISITLKALIILINKGMKKISCLMALAFVSVMVFTSCRPSVIFSHVGGNTLEPSNKIITKNYTDLDFQSVDFSSVGSVEFVQTQGGKCSVSITAPDNYVPIYIVKVEKGTLKIYNEDGYNLKDADVKIIISGPTLKSIDNSGVGKIKIASLNTTSLDIDNSGVGKIKIDSLEAAAVKVDNSGVGSVDLKGKASKVSLDCSGVGSIDAAKLHAVIVNADVSGVGGVKCYASEEISGDVSGVGSLKYAGHPAKKHLNSNDVVGKIEEINE